MTARVFDLLRPNVWRSGLIVASPHSGRDYPDWFLRESRLPLSDLRSSEDAFVDELARPALEAGAVVLLARLPRTLVDLNRGADEIDPLVVEGARGVLHPRAAHGLGVIPRLVAQGRAIRRAPMAPAEAQRRLDLFWRPWHHALASLIEDAAMRFGHAVLLDLHSMPGQSVSALHPRPDAVVGDRNGRSASARMRDLLTGALAEEGLRTRLNSPFAGAFVAEAYGAPARGRHVLQLELDRTLYMDEAALCPHEGLPRLVEVMARVHESLARRLETPFARAAE